MRKEKQFLPDLKGRGILAGCDETRELIKRINASRPKPVVFRVQ